MNENEHPEPTDSGNDHDPVLEAAGARLRAESTAISPEGVQVRVLRRRARRLTLVAGASVALVAVLAGLLLVPKSSEPKLQVAGAPSAKAVDQLLASLDKQPVNPTRVKLVSSVSTFPDCAALIGDLRKVGAQHVGSQGFGANGGGIFQPVGERMSSEKFTTANAAASDAAAPAGAQAGPADGTTLGTNVQVAGVDELDYVKAVGKFIYDLDGKGYLRITDATTLQVLSTLDVIPKKLREADNGGGGGDFGPYRPGGAQVNQLLVADGKVAIFGSESETSKPVEGDPSATQSSTSFMSVSFVDATDPAAPKITDRVRVEGSLVSARLVGGEIRLVTTSNMSDLGFVMPTTPNSVAKALEQNRRSVATSSAADWIPDWERDGGKAQPLVPCERVHVPDTFAGVAMTSMVTFPLGSGRFDPAGTSILAPATTLYAGLDKVAISSEVWVDPIDRDRLEFKNWQTAVHEFSFGDKAAPTYVGSGIVDGSTVGQFAFGQLGDSLAVVTTKGTPWAQDLSVGVDLTVLTPDGRGKLDQTAKVADLSNGKGAVSAVRFIEGRVLISSGLFGRDVDVIDVNDPAKPRRAGRISLPGTVGYFHPLPDHQALVVGSRYDTVGEGRDQQQRSWVQVKLLDVSNADDPKVLGSWEKPWTADEVGSDHHAFTYWPDRKLAMWGVQDTEWNRNDSVPNHAVVLHADGGIDEVAMPVANKPNEVPAPCPVVPVTAADAQQGLLSPDSIVLRCDDKDRKEIEWPRYGCYRLDGRTVAQYAPGEEKNGSFFVCSPAPQPTVSRVLVVSGRPILLTDQTLEALDPDTFQSTAIAYHPMQRGGPIAY